MGPWSIYPPPGLSDNVHGILTDGAFFFYPLHNLVWSEWRQGITPLWNPYILAGTPLLGDDQSAVFNPTALLTLPLTFPDSWTVVTLSKVFLAGLGSYLFLCRLRLHILAALFGSIAFMFSSFFVVWLFSTATTVAAYLPWLFWAVELLMSPSGSTIRRYRIFPMFTLAIVVCFQFFGGHLEISSFLLLTSSFYAAVRSFDAWHAGYRQVLLRFTLYLISTVWGLALAAVQLLPAAATILHSYSYQYRAATGGLGKVTLPLHALLTWFVPNILGNPTLGTHKYYAENNFIEMTGYAGIGTLLLALWSWQGAVRTRLFAVYGAFLALLIIATGIVYGFPVFRLLTLLPPLRFTVNIRLHLVASFALATLAAFGMEALIAPAVPESIAPSQPVRQSESETPDQAVLTGRSHSSSGTRRRKKGAQNRKQRGKSTSTGSKPTKLIKDSGHTPWTFLTSKVQITLLSLLAACGGVPLFLLVVVFQLARSFPSSAVGNLVIRSIHGFGIGTTPDWMNLALEWSEVAAVIALLAWVAAWVASLSSLSGRLRAWIGATLVALCFVDLFLFGSGVNPTIMRSAAFSKPPPIAALQSLAHGSRITADIGTLPPDTSASYQLRDLRGYEAVTSARPIRYFMRAGLTYGFYNPPSMQRLSLANATYYLSGTQMPGTTTATVGLPNSGVVGEIYGRREIVQTFTVPRDNLAGLGVLTATYLHRIPSNPVEVTVIDQDRHHQLFNRKVPGNTIPNNGFLPLTFPAVQHIADHRLELTVRFPSGHAGQAPTIGVRAGIPPAGTRLLISGHQVKGALSMEMYFRSTGAQFVPVWTDGKYTIWHNVLARPRVYFASRVLAEPTERAVLRTLATVGVDNNAAHGQQTVIVEQPGGRSRNYASGSTTITHDVPGDVEVVTRSAGMGFLTLTEGYEPGWRATIDGRSVPMYHTNELFQGVYIPSGHHTEHFYYAPTEFIVGALVSAVAVAIGVIGCVFAWVRRARLLPQTSAP